MSRKGPGPITRAIERRAILAAENAPRENRRIQPYTVEPVPGGAVRVINHRGQGFLIDSDDLLGLAECRFTVAPDGEVTVWGAIVDRKNNRLSRILMKPEPGEVVDHINGDPSDNRRINLRTCSPSENACNTRISKRNTSGFKGVARHKSGRFKAYASHDRQWHNLGTFQTAELAAHAYDAFARKAFGRFACVNFPLDGEQSAHRERPYA